LRLVGLQLRHAVLPLALRQAQGEGFSKDLILSLSKDEERRR